MLYLYICYNFIDRPATESKNNEMTLKSPQGHQQCQLIEHLFPISGV